MIREYPKGQSLQLSPHFNINEFHCHCNYPECRVTYLDSDLIEYLEKKRTQIGKPFKVNSGFRCEKHNRDVGGKPRTKKSKGSEHMRGLAADIVVKGEDMRKLADLFEDADGLGRYSNFVHVDVRGYKSRWRG